MVDPKHKVVVRIVVHHFIIRGISHGAFLPLSIYLNELDAFREENLNSMSQLLAEMVV